MDDLRAGPIPVEVRMEHRAEQLGEHITGVTSALLREGSQRIRDLKEACRYHTLAYEAQDGAFKAAIVVIVVLGAAVAALTSKFLGLF